MISDLEDDTVVAKQNKSGVRSKTISGVINLVNGKFLKIYTSKDSI